MSPAGRATRRFFGSLHTRLYELSGGAIGGRVGRAPVLLLTTRGRKTGKPRTSPLLYIADGPSYVVVASNGGAPTHPAWFLNLQANPDAAVHVRRDRHRVHARIATPDERDRYWPQLDAIYKWYASYRKKTTREIPLVVLEPRA